MKPKANGAIQRAQKIKHVQGEGPNWVIIAGGALLSTLSIRLGCKLKQIFETKLSKNFNNAKENGKFIAKRMPGACQLHSKLYCYTQDEDGCYHCLSGISDGAQDIKRPPASPLSKDTDVSLPLVKIPDGSGVMWASSPDRLELPQRPFHHSNSSDSPRVSESGSDIYSRREVIQKLRQQLKRRDEMIMEMQAQIMDLQNSLSIQMTHSVNLQSQLDSANRDLFDAEREIQRLRKAIADHCVAEAEAEAEAGTLGKPVATRSWRSEAINVQVKGLPDNLGDDVVLQWQECMRRWRGGSRC